MSDSIQQTAGPAVVNPRTDEVVDVWMRKRAASDPALRAAWAVHPVVPPADPEPDESDDGDEADDVINVIGWEHGLLRQLQQQLQALPGATSGGSPDDLRRREEALAALRTRLEPHEEAESRVFWPMVRDRIQEGEELAVRGVDQEGAAEKLVAQLAGNAEGGTDGGAPAEFSSAYDDLVTELVVALRKHLALEDLVLSRVYDTLNRQERVELGRRFKAARQAAAAGRVRPQRMAGHVQRTARS